MAESLDSDFPGEIESFDDRDLAVIHRMFDEAPELQLGLADYQTLLPALPAEEAALCGDAVRQIEIASVEGDEVVVETMTGYIRKVLIDHKIIL